MPLQSSSGLNSPKQIWVTDPNNKKYSQIKQNFLLALQQQTKDLKIGYYDFLLVAKKLAFRFEQSSHLMSLKNYFNKNKNVILCKKLADCLSINLESLNNSSQEKVIVRFNVPDVHFAPIKQQTLEDEQYEDNQQNNENAIQNSNENYGAQNMPFQKLGGQISEEHQKQLIEKMAIILSIKVQQMHKKIRILTSNTQTYSLISYFTNNFQTQQQITYQNFKKGIIELISQQKQKIKLSEDDVKTIFHILDEEKNQYLTIAEIKNLQNIDSLMEKMKQFYQARLNKQMVKNTLFKLGKVKNNSIQIYQLKNASLMEFKQMQDAILNDPISKRGGFNVRTNKQGKEKNRIPHFGPLKGAAKMRKQKQQQYQTKSQPHYPNTYGITYPLNNVQTNVFSINKQREKIQKILRQSKQMNFPKGQKNGQTVASKLRSLFIHKVILPRQKMLEQEKGKFFKSKVPEHQLSIKPYK